MNLRMNMRTLSSERFTTLKLLERLAGVFLATLMTGVILAFVGVVNVSIQDWALNLATAAALGLASGLASRVVLRRYGWGLRLSTALATTVMSLIFVGWLTAGFAGISPHLGGQAHTDWVGLARVALGILGAALALRAWRPSISPGGNPSPDAVAEPEPNPGWAASPTNHESGHRPESAPRSDVGLPLSGARSPRPERVRSLGTTLSDRLRFRSRRRPSTSAKAIHLAEGEEHRCPYCLELVAPGDRRGVVICPVCHTYHHADCWAITGVCQVPHHHD